MNNPAAKAQAIADEVLGRKQRIWEKLKMEANECAEFVSTITDIFGKPDAVEIAFSDGQQYRSAKIRDAQDYPDFESRSEASHKFFADRDSKCSAAGIESTERNSK